jgi:hypothetical protein
MYSISLFLLRPSVYPITLRIHRFHINQNDIRATFGLRHSLIEARRESKPFPSTGKEPALSAAEGLDRGDSLLHMLPFSFSVGERKIMNYFVLQCFFRFRLQLRLVVPIV